MNLELLARLRSASLDGRLARGELPGHGRLLAVRAVQLTDRHRRAELADQWLALLRPRPTSLLSARLSVDEAQVLAARDDILALAALLRDARTPPVRVVARARQLLTDGTGPVFRRTGDLRAALAGLLAVSVRT